MMRVALPSWKYIILLTGFWIGALGVGPLIFFVGGHQPATEREIVFAYLIGVSPLLPLLPASYLVVGAAESIYRIRGHVKVTSRILVAVGLFTVSSILLTIGIVWTYVGYLSKSPITILVSLGPCIAGALLVVPSTRRLVDSILEDNGS
jgi:hypothetical protein